MAVCSVDLSRPDMVQPVVLPVDSCRRQPDLCPIPEDMGQDRARRLLQRKETEHDYRRIQPGFRHLHPTSSTASHLAPKHVVKKKAWYSIDLRRWALVSPLLSIGDVETGLLLF